MAKYRKSEVKKCPRCGEKLLFNAPKCPECGLLFSRLSLVTNKAGKRCVRKRQKDKILRVTAWPEDAKRWKALLLCGFLGFYGAHNFYLGRYAKATFSLVFSVITTVLASMSAAFYETVFYNTFIQYFAIPAAFPLLFWVLDFVYIAIGKYKIPVSIPEDVKEII